MTRRLPNLLYVGDIPVEASYQSSIQLHRLLSGYPREQLQIIETREPGSQTNRRLHGVSYHFLPLANRATMRGAWSGAYRVWLTATARQRAPEALWLIAGFEPDAILTIGSGFGWLVAAEIAHRLDLPLHFIAHDDWPKARGIDRAVIAWSRSRFGRAYRAARSRLCVSPFMIEEFERRYGVRGDLLYPVRAPEVAASREPAVRTLTAADTLTIAFCGGSGSHVMPGLKALGKAIDGMNARIIVYGPFDQARQRELQSIAGAFEFRGFVDHGDMMAGLGGADLLFAPMTFDAAARDNMAVSLPSKLVDYTAAAVPILVHAPSYSSAVRWAEMHDHAAAVVTVDDPVALRDAIGDLRTDRARRQLLAERAVRAGDACFDFAAGRAVLEGALR
jgi:hypothetical protein